MVAGDVRFHTAGAGLRKMAGNGEAAARRDIGWWLLILAAMVFVMVDLGGWTRLTGSGLSMTRWQPATVVPPLDRQAWQDMFDAYRTSPQFRLVNHDMTLEQFKGIFWLEFVHRLWGRLIGVAFLAPFLWFLARRRIGRAEAPRIFVIFLLGAAEGVLGWLMVKSGLIDEPHVSHLRLTAHLTTGMLIYGAALWMALGYLMPPAALPDPEGARRLRRRLSGVLILVCLAIPAGGLVAGLHAGMMYNTFPLMGDSVLPDEAFTLASGWRNVIDNPVLVQFDHRVLAILTWLASVLVWGWSWRLDLPHAQRGRVALVPMAATVQAGLGIATLLTFVPVPLAVAHQAGAFVLVGIVIWAIRGLRAAPAPGS